MAGISPTTASRALHRLQHLSLVRRRRRRVMLGAVTDVEVWEIDVRKRRWGELAPVLETRLQFIDAQDQHPVDPTVKVAGIQVAGLRDLLATKLKVIGDLEHN